MIDVEMYYALLLKTQAEGTVYDVKKFLQELYDFGWEEGYGEGLRDGKAGRECNHS